MIGLKLETDLFLLKNFDFLFDNVNSWNDANMFKERIILLLVIKMFQFSLYIIKRILNKLDLRIVLIE